MYMSWHFFCICSPFQFYSGVEGFIFMLCLFNATVLVIGVLAQEFSVKTVAPSHVYAPVSTQTNGRGVGVFLSKMQ